jgi:ketosteroid isomerase-like protein
MSQENVEIVKAGFEAWNAGDMDAFRERYDPDVIVRTPEGWPEPGPYVGRDAFMRWCEQLRETWDADALELISDFTDAGDRVAVRFIWHGAGRGPEADLEMTGVYTVRKGSSDSSAASRASSFVRNSLSSVTLPPRNQYATA